MCVAHTHFFGGSSPERFESIKNYDAYANKNNIPHTPKHICNRPQNRFTCPLLICTHICVCVWVCVCMCLIEWCEGRTCLSRGARMYVCILRNYNSSWGCTQAYFPPVAHKQFWNVCIHTYTFIWMWVCVLSPRNFEDCLLRFAHTLTYVFTSQQCLHMHKMLFWRKNIM